MRPRGAYVMGRTCSGRSAASGIATGMDGGARSRRITRRFSSSLTIPVIRSRCRAERASTSSPTALRPPTRGRSTRRATAARHRGRSIDRPPRPRGRSHRRAHARRGPSPAGSGERLFELQSRPSGFEPGQGVLDPRWPAVSLDRRVAERPDLVGEAAAAVARPLGHRASHGGKHESGAQPTVLEVRRSPTRATEVGRACRCSKTFRSSGSRRRSSWLRGFVRLHCPVEVSRSGVSISTRPGSTRHAPGTALP